MTSHISSLAVFSFVISWDHCVKPLLKLQFVLFHAYVDRMCGPISNDAEKVFRFGLLALTAQH